jgi:hypothetical protein
MTRTNHSALGKTRALDTKPRHRLSLSITGIVTALVVVGLAIQVWSGRYTSQSKDERRRRNQDDRSASVHSNPDSPTQSGKQSRQSLAGPTGTNMDRGTRAAEFASQLVAVPDRGFRSPSEEHDAIWTVLSSSGAGSGSWTIEAKEALREVLSGQEHSIIASNQCFGAACIADIVYLEEQQGSADATTPDILLEKLLTVGWPGNVMFTGLRTENGRRTNSILLVRPADD